LRRLIPGFKDYDREGLNLVTRHIYMRIQWVIDKVSKIIYGQSTPYLQMAIEILRRRLSAYKEYDSGVDDDSLALIDVKVIEVLESMESLLQKLEFTRSSPLGREYEELIYRHALRINELLYKREVVIESRGSQSPV